MEATVKPDSKLLKAGFIALQSEGQPVDFRKVAIVNLEKHANDPVKLNEWFES